MNNLFSGEYHTAYRGRGMTFSEFREYVPGDDVRTISWTVTARTGKPHIKKFDEERELTLFLVVDVSASGDFGSGEYFKGEIMAHLAALLGFSAAKNNDQIGMVLFSDQVEKYVPAGKGRGHVQRLLRDILYHQPASRRTRLAPVLEFLSGILKKKSIVFIVSDFLDEDFDGPLRQLGRKHDVTAVVVQDPLELEIPSVGLVDFHDPETGEVFTIDTSSKKFREDYSRRMAMLKKRRDDELKKAQVEKVLIQTNQNYVDPLIAFFKRRNK